MFLHDGRSLALAALVVAAYPSHAYSEIIYTFGNGGVLDNDGADDTAVFPAPDDQSGIFGTITTRAVTNADGTDGAALNENSESLGINSVGSEASGSAFDGLEAWTFSWDVDTTLDFIDFGAFSGSETMAIGSAGWQGKEFTIEETRNLTFDSSEGQFLFGDDGVDAFDLTNIISGDSLLVSHDTAYTFSFGTGGGSAAIEQLTFSAPATSVPEPGSGLVLLGLAGAAIGRHWHHKNKRRHSAPLRD